MLKLPNDYKFKIINNSNWSPRRSNLCEILADRLDYSIAQDAQPKRDGYAAIEKYKNWRRSFLRDDPGCTNQPQWYQGTNCIATEQSPHMIISKINRHMFTKCCDPPWVFLVSTSSSIPLVLDFRHPVFRLYVSSQSMTKYLLLYHLTN